jgi:ACS family pantothenate transporter-like MFS transporter
METLATELNPDANHRSDRAAFANAYVSGLKESLDMTGDDYNKILAVTTAGYVSMTIPSFDHLANSLQQHGSRPAPSRDRDSEDRASPLVPVHGCCLGDPNSTPSSSVQLYQAQMLTIPTQMASAAAKSVTQLCVIRFLLGLAEASTYSGAIYIMGAWYKSDEIAKRTALFTASGQVGTMFAGVMMTAINKGMAGKGSLVGWQWVFLIGRANLFVSHIATQY